MKKEEKTKITQSRIIKIAVKEFGSYGYEGASVNRICDSGISKGLIYHNFENKDAIYLAVVKKCYDELILYLKCNITSGDLQSYMDNRVAFFKKNPYYAAIFMEVILRTPKNIKEQIDLIRKEFDEFNEEVYKSIIDVTSLRSGITREDAIAYFKLIQTMFNGYFFSDESVQEDFSTILEHHENKLSKIMEFILYGIAERKNNG